MTLAEDVAALQQRLAQAERDRARAEGARDAAQTAADNARAELLRDFCVTSVDQAEQLLETLRADLALITAEISERLDEIGV